MIKKVWLCLILLVIAITANADLVDPTRPADVLLSTMSNRSGLTLNATYVSTDSKFAIINSKLVFLGDKIFGYTVKNINKQKVVLENESGLLTLELGTNIIKRTSHKDVISNENIN